MLTFCQMTQNRLVETRTCLEKYLPYIDQAIIIDGGSIDDSIFYFRNWAEKEPKIKFFISPFKDHFSDQRNQYLSRVPDNTWALVSDPDEVFEEITLKALPELIQKAEDTKHNLVGFRCRSASYKGPIRVWENLDNSGKDYFLRRHQAFTMWVTLMKLLLE